MTPAFFKSATINSATSQDLLKVYFPSQIYCRLIGYLLLLARHSAWSRQNSRLYATVEIRSEDWNRSCRRTDRHSSEPRLKEARFKEPWYVGDTPSLGIGQGYNAFTLLQLAHATATLANRGIIMTPHLVDKVENPVTGESIKVDAEPTGKIPLKDANLDVVIAGMTDVTRTGTARSVFQGAPYSVAGKTGTAQVISIAQDDRWDEKKFPENTSTMRYSLLLLLREIHALLWLFWLKMEDLALVLRLLLLKS